MVTIGNENGTKELSQDSSEQSSNPSTSTAESVSEEIIHNKKCEDSPMMDECSNSELNQNTNNEDESFVTCSEESVICDSEIDNSVAVETNSNISQLTEVNMIKEDCPLVSQESSHFCSATSQHQESNAAAATSDSSSFKETRDSATPDNAPKLLVGNRVSDDSDASMESESEVEEVVPPSKQRVDKDESNPDLTTDVTEVTVLTTSDDIQNGDTTNETNDRDIVVLDNIASSNYRFTIDIASGTDDSESDSDSSSSSSSSASQVSSSLSEDEDTSAPKEPANDSSEKQKEPKKKRNGMILTHGELTIEDLPPIEDLQISVPEEEAQVIGYVLNIVDQQVVVQGHHGIPAVDLDSVLFMENGKRALGQIFDVFGHVHEPVYVVRFNSNDHVKENNINIGDPVFYAPSTEHTNFVVIEALMRIRGSDASGLTGNEPAPTEVTDFSDDEEEARVKGSARQNKFKSSTGEYQPGQKRMRNERNDHRDRGQGRNQGGRGGRGQGRNFNPFGEHGMNQRGRGNFGRGSKSRQNFDPWNPRAGPSRLPDRSPSPMQGPPFITDYGHRSFSPYPNHGEMNGNRGHDMKPSFSGPSQNGPWQSHSNQQYPPPSQFGGPPQFQNQMGYPPQTPPPSYYNGPPPFLPGPSYAPPPTTPTPPPGSPFFSPSSQNTGPPPPYMPSYSPHPSNPPGAPTEHFSPPRGPFRDMGPPPMQPYPPHTPDYNNMPPPHSDAGPPHYYQQHHPSSSPRNEGWVSQGPAPPPYPPPPPPAIPPPPDYPSSPDKRRYPKF